MHKIAIPLVILVLGAAAFFVLTTGDNVRTGTGAGTQPEEQRQADGEALVGDGAAKEMQEGERVEAGKGAAAGAGEKDGIRVSGRLTLEGEGVEGVRVGLRHLEAGSLQQPGFGVRNPGEKVDSEARSDAEGRFAFRVPRDQAGSLELIESRYLWSRIGPHFMKSDRDLNLGDLSLVPGVPFAGRVVDELGVVVAGVKITAYSSEVPTMPAITSTDTNGNFRFHGLRRGPGTLMASADGFATVQEAVSVVGIQTDPFVFQMVRGGTLHGEVVDDRLEPVVGAKIQISGGHRSVGKRQEYTSCRVDSDAQGKFRATGLIGDTFTVSGSAEGHVKNRVRKVALADGSVRLILQRHATLSGVLKDENGQPLRGSVVNVTKTEPKPASPPSPGPVSMEVFGGWSTGEIRHSGGNPSDANKTDAEGRFRLEGVEPGTLWLIATGAHKRSVLGPVTAVPGGEQGEIAIVAERGPVVAATVRGPDGGPIAGARVSLRKKSGKNSGSFRGMASTENVIGLDRAGPMLVRGFSSPSQSAKTNEEGLCELGGMKPGEYELHVSHKEWVNSDPVAVIVPKQGREEVEVELRSGGRLRIEIVDATGAPAGIQSFVIQAPLAAGKKKPKRVKTGKSDSTGRAVTGPIRAGQYQLVLEATGDMAAYIIGWSSSNKTIGEPVPVRVVDGETREVQVVMPKLASLVGTVMGAQGIERNARVCLAPRSPKGAATHNRWMSMRNCRTGADGRFRIEGIPEGEYDLEVQSAHYPLGFQRRITIAGSAEHRESVVLQSGVLIMKVQEGDQPREGVDLVLRPKKKTLIPDWTGESKQEMTVTTDAQGVARFADVPPGAFHVSVSGGGFHKAKVDVVVEAGAEKSGSLKVRSAGSVVISCLQEDGKPWSYFQYELTRLGPEEKQVAKAWRYSKKPIGGLEAGRYRVRVRRGGNKRWAPPKVVEVVPGREAKVDFVLP